MSEALTYVVVRGSAEAEDLRRHVEPWCREQLVTPFLVVPATAVRSGDDPLATWTDHRGEAPALPAAAEHPYRVLRVVGFQTIGHGAGGDPAVPAAARMLRAELERLTSSQQQLYAINVLVPDGLVQGLPVDLLDLHATANVVVAPEDRAGPMRTAVRLDEEERRVAHGIHNLFGIAGLWRHQSDGPFDTREFQATLNEPLVVVTRGFGRVLRATDLVDRVARRVFEQRQGSMWGIRALRAQPVEDGSAIVDAQAQRLLGRHRAVLEAPTIQPSSAPAVTKVGILQAFAMMFRFIFRGLRAMPLMVRDAATESTRRAVGEFTQQVAFGGDSRMHVRRPEAPEEELDETAQVQDLAASLLRRTGGGSPAPSSSADLWRELRSVSFGLLDAGDFPDGFDQPTTGSEREVLVDPRQVVPSPADRFVPATDGLPLTRSVRRTIGSVDVLQARALQGELRNLVDPSSGDDDDDNGSSTDNDAPSPHLPPPPPPPPATDDVIGGRDEAEAELERLEAWIATREASLVGRVALHVADAIAEGRRVLRKALNVATQGPPPGTTAAEMEARSTLLRRWRWIFGVILVISLLQAGRNLALGITVGPLGYAQWVGGWVVVALAAMVVAFMSYQRKLFQLRHRLEVEAERHRAAIRTAVEAAQQLVTLAAVNRQLRDWAEVIGRLAHNPSVPIQLRDEDAFSDVGFLPESHRLAFAVEGGASDIRLAAMVGGRLFARRWLSDLFDEVRTASVGQLKHDLGLDETDPDPDPDVDRSIRGARSHLVDQLRDGWPTRHWTDRKIEEVGEHLHGLEPDEVISLVQEVGVDADPRGADGFLNEVVSDIAVDGPGAGDVAVRAFTPYARMHEHARIRSTTVWTTVQLRTELRDTVRVEVGGARDTAGAIFEIALVRTDTTQPVPASSFELFAMRSSVTVSSDPGTERPDGDVW